MALVERRMPSDARVVYDAESSDEHVTSLCGVCENEWLYEGASDRDCVRNAMILLRGRDESRQYSDPPDDLRDLQTLPVVVRHIHQHCFFASSS